MRSRGKALVARRLVQSVADWVLCASGDLASYKVKGGSCTRGVGVGTY